MLFPARTSASIILGSTRRGCRHSETNIPSCRQVTPTARYALHRLLCLVVFVCFVPHLLESLWKKYPFFQDQGNPWKQKNSASKILAFSLVFDRDVNILQSALDTRQCTIVYRISKILLKRHLLCSCGLYTHTCLPAVFPGLPRWSGTRKVNKSGFYWSKRMSGSGIRWAICKSAPRSREKPCQHPTTQFFTDRMPFLPPNQQRQSTEGNWQIFLNTNTQHVNCIIWSTM